MTDEEKTPHRDSSPRTCSIVAAAQSDPISLDTEAEVRAIEKALIRRVDWCVIPLIMFLYLFSFLDRVNIGNARLYGMEKDLGLTGNQYQVCVSILFVTYCVSHPCHHLHPVVERGIRVAANWLIVIRGALQPGSEEIQARPLHCPHHNSLGLNRHLVWSRAQLRLPNRLSPAPWHLRSRPFPRLSNLPNTLLLPAPTRPPHRLPLHRCRPSRRLRRANRLRNILHGWCGGPGGLAMDRKSPLYTSSKDSLTKPSSYSKVFPPSSSGSSVSSSYQTTLRPPISCPRMRGSCCCKSVFEKSDKR